MTNSKFIHGYHYEVLPPNCFHVTEFAGEELVGNYKATFYNVNGINLETRKRREHLSDADLQKNKQLLESFTKGNMEHGGKCIKI